MAKQKPSTESDVLNLDALTIIRTGVSKANKPYKVVLAPPAQSKGVDTTPNITVGSGGLSVGFGYGDSLKESSLLDLLDYMAVEPRLEATLRQRKALGKAGAVHSKPTVASTAADIADLKAMLLKALGNAK